jgi:hypothetical protein
MTIDLGEVDTNSPRYVAASKICETKPGVEASVRSFLNHDLREGCLLWSAASQPKEASAT